jgi:hypothetical protein
VFFSPNESNQVKEDDIGGGGHVALMGDMKMCTKFQSENLKEMCHFVHLDVDGGIILKRFSRK